jgi:porphobilinogen synthase
MTTKTLNPTTDLAAAPGIATRLTRRPRRLRRSESIRSLVRETVVLPEDLIYPLFVVPNSRPRAEIKSMRGVWQTRVADAV